MKRTLPQPVVRAKVSALFSRITAIPWVADAFSTMKFKAIPSSGQNMCNYESELPLSCPLQLE
jgi:hypothetical protein